MMARAFMLIGILGMSACTTEMQDDLARDAAKNAVRPVLSERLPGIPVEPATDCIIENASANEILALAADAVTGPTASTVQMVTDIAARPGTIQCLATEGLPALIGRL